MIRNLSHGAQEMFEKMSEAEINSFMDNVTRIGMRMQPFTQDVEIVIDRLVSEEGEKLYENSEGYRNMMAMREKFNADFESRLKTQETPSVEDPSEELEKLTRRLMVEKGLDYSAALNMAQTMRKDLAEKILERLNKSRGKK